MLEVLLLSVLFFVVAFCLPPRLPVHPRAPLTWRAAAAPPPTPTPRPADTSGRAPRRARLGADRGVGGRISLERALLRARRPSPARPVARSGPHARRRLSGGDHLRDPMALPPERQYSEMATLFQSGQEGLIKFLLQLGSDRNEAIAIPALGWFLLTYYLLAVAIFGISVPSGQLRARDDHRRGGWGGSSARASTTRPTTAVRTSTRARFAPARRGGDALGRDAHDARALGAAGRGDQGHRRDCCTS